MQWHIWVILLARCLLMTCNVVTNADFYDTIENRCRELTCVNHVLQRHRQTIIHYLEMNVRQNIEHMQSIGTLWYCSQCRVLHQELDEILLHSCHSNV